MLGSGSAGLLRMGFHDIPAAAVQSKRGVLAACTQGTVGMTMSAWWELS